MRDVRGVFAGFAIVALVAVAILALVARRAPDPEARARFRRAVRDGARGLAVGLVAAGVVAVLAFDAAFEVFHRLFFASGTYTFDPRTSKLVQLFPESFWSETAIAVGVVAIVVALGVQSIAARSAIA
jgi:integral membrane protein (TIGR01906 family)